MTFCSFRIWFRGRVVAPLLFATSLFGVVACSSNSADTTDSTDTTTDTANNGETTDSTDTPNTADTSDTADSADSADSTDNPDTVDATTTDAASDAADTSDTAAVFCGNRALDEGEDCDGDLLGEQTCEAAGFVRGELACTNSCSLDTSGCLDSECGDGECNGSETTTTCVLDCTPEGFVRIESGTFTMGSPEDELGRHTDENAHTVTLTRAFLLQTTEVTQGQYESLIGENPSYFDDCGANCPVETVTWFDAVAYANALSVSEGLPECYGDAGEVLGGSTLYDCTGYRLPTEAEWEYAARAGTTTATHAGNLSAQECADTTLLSIAWFCGNAAEQTHSVGGKAPNAWGVYDMLGNVWEWTSDWYDTYPETVTDPLGASSGSGRVLRGGGWFSSAQGARAAYRYAGGNPTYSSYAYGFRLARSLP